GERRRRRVHSPAGQRHAPNRVLAWLARCGDSAAGAGLSRGDRRRTEQANGGAEKACMSVLRILNLSKAFGGVHAVENVSFEVGEAEFLALIGPNGAGKSTCFNMTNAQLPPDPRSPHFPGRPLPTSHP